MDLDNVRRELMKIRGVGEAKAEKLIEVGIRSPYILALMNTFELVDKGFGESEARQIIYNAKEFVGLHTTYTAKELRKIMVEAKRLTTGCYSLDLMLDGGLEPRAIYEFTGPAKAGKTQICHQLCVTAFKTLWSGGQSKIAVYIDTEETFRPDRIEAIAGRFECDIESVLDAIIVKKPITFEEQILAVNDIAEICAYQNVKLVVVDSIIAKARSQLTGREKLAERQQLLNYMLDMLLRIAKIFKAYIAVTNEVQASPTPWGGSDLPTGGHILAHGTTHRIWLHRISKEQEGRAEVIDSPSLPPRSCRFKVVVEGVI
ncbi:MAG: DNA repair and recombination protein RadA [Candidatus Methanomethylicia archaeon]